MESQENMQDDMDERLKSWKPPYDDNAFAEAKINVMNRIREQGYSPKLERSKKYTWLKSAAVILAIFGAGIGLYLSGNVKFENQTSEKTTYTLPDKSEIILTENSRLEYNKYQWLWNRSIEFTGEGYFNVYEGNEFTIHLTEGEVNVLGTTFTIWANDTDWLVHCSSGKVRVQNKSQSIVLSRFEFTQVTNGRIAPKMLYEKHDFIAPRNTSVLSFESVPVGIVLKELEKGMGIKVKNDLPTNLIYTGILDISDVNACFEVFCKPFGAVFDRTTDGMVSIYL